MKTQLQFFVLLGTVYLGLATPASPQNNTKANTIQTLRNLDWMMHEMHQPGLVTAPDRSPKEPNTNISPTFPHSNDPRQTAQKKLLQAQKLMMNPATVEQSVESLKKVVDEFPNYTPAYILMGVAYGSLQKWDEADKAFAKAVELAPTNAIPYIGLGSVENEQKIFVEAENHLLKGVEFAPDSADAHFELGRAYFGQGRWDLAGQQVAKANQLRSDSPQQHVFMGNILLRERNAEGALKEFQEAVRLDPSGPLAAPTQQMIERIETAIQTSAQK